VVVRLVRKKCQDDRPYFDRAGPAIEAKAGGDAALWVGAEELAVNSEQWPVVGGAMVAAWLARPRNSDCFHGRLLVAVNHRRQSGLNTTREKRLSRQLCVYSARLGQLFMRVTRN
jgi:hypothetical protein